MCGSDLHLEIGGSCIPTDLAPVAVGTRVCPDLSQGRFDGGSYDYVADPLDIVDNYAQAELVPIWQAEDDARTWERYCTRPLVTVNPTPTALPIPTPTAEVVNLELRCAQGSELRFDSVTGAPFCEVQSVAPVPATNAPVPAFTG